MKINEQQASKLEENEIDPIFCKAYGVMYNPDRSKEVFMSSAKAEQLDREYTQYLDERTENKKKETETDEQVSTKKPDVIRKALLKEEMEDSSLDSEDQAERQKAWLALESARKRKNNTGGDHSDRKDPLLSRRDDLKIKSLAKYKAVRDGDLHMYDEIEN